MDRRDALKKLGVGGAVAVAGPVLLDSFKVASAASPYPDAGDLQIVVSWSWSTNQKEFTIGNIAGEFVTGTQYQWSDAAPATAPALVFSPSSGNSTPTGGPNTVVTTTTGNGQFETIPFTAELTVDSGAKSYQFFWNGSNALIIS